MAVPGQPDRDVSVYEGHPGARCGHTLTHLQGAGGPSGGKLVIFGGTALKKEQSTESSEASESYAGGSAVREERTAHVHALSLFDGHWRHVTIQACGAPPPVGRMGHAAVAVGGALLIHGGLAADGTVLDDLFLLRMSRLGTSGHWERIGTVMRSGCPCARYGHSMAFLADRYVVLFGGSSGRSAVGDTWVLDVGPGASGLGLGAADMTAPLAVADEAAAVEVARARAEQAASGVRQTHCAWRQLLSSGCPSPRSFAATAASAETLYVCGGVSADKTALSDAFRLECERSGDSVTWRWRRLPDVPVARVHAAAAVAGGRVHVVGGMVGECTLPEAGESVLVLHEEGMWEEAAVEGDAGRALCAARLTVAACGAILYVHGGIGHAPTAQAPPLLSASAAYATDGATLRAHALRLRSHGSGAVSSVTAAARDAAPGAACPPPGASAAPSPPPPADGGRWSDGRAHSSAAGSVGHAQPPAFSHDDGNRTASDGATSMYVSPYHEIPDDAPQETAIIETGLISGSAAPHVDAVSRAYAAPRPPPPPGGRLFPPPAVAAAATPEPAGPYAASPPGSGPGSALKRSASISRSVMWVPLPTFVPKDPQDEHSGDEPPVFTPDPDTLNPYSTTVDSDGGSVPHTPPYAARAARPAQPASPQSSSGSYGTGACERPAAPVSSNAAGAPHAAHGNDMEPGRRPAAAAAVAPGPAPRASNAAARQVAKQLASLRTSKIYKKYTVVEGRHVGGRSVIQFAVLEPRGRNERVAVKLYAEDAAGRAAFQAEKEAIADPALKPLLPPVYHVHDNSRGAHVDGRGQRMPPAIAFARGTTLAEVVVRFWRRPRPASDNSELHAPLACAARCLRDLHAACVVHRDLRPGHILWFPDSPGGADTSASTSGGGDRCAFVDLAYAVPCGAGVPLSYTLTYAAPEIVEADARGDKTIAATPQHDEWALGVLMFEALTGHPAFDLLALGEAGVTAQLLGRRGELLPWEHPGAAAQLGCFWKPLCGLLRRDPAARLNISQFYDACNAELAVSTRVTRGRRPWPGDGGGGASDAVSSGGHSCDSPEAAGTSGATARSKREILRAAKKEVSNFFMRGLTRTSTTGE